MFKDYFAGQQGYEDLRKYIKQGNEFCRELAACMQERSDAEASYAKSLSKVSNKLTKAATQCIGTMASAWSLVAAETEAQAEQHRQLSDALAEEVYKRLKALAEAQAKSRKPVEATVDKANKAYMEKRADEVKSKKSSHAAARDREKLHETLGNARAGRGKPISDKDIAKLEKGLRKQEESLVKADRHYYDVCQQAEQHRQECDSAIAKACASLQQLECDRMAQLQETMSKYCSHLALLPPALSKSVNKLSETALSVDVDNDIQLAARSRGTPAERGDSGQQLLPDFYAEDMQQSMERERRRQLLAYYITQLQQDIDSQRKAREGVDRLVSVYTSRPNFADAAAQEDASTRLSQVSVMINYLEAAHFKVSCAMCELEGRPKPASRLAKYIQRSNSSGGKQAVSILRVPASEVFQTQSSSGGGGGGGGGGGESAYRSPADGSFTPAPPSDGAVYGRRNYEPVVPSLSSSVSSSVGSSVGGSVGSSSRKQTAPAPPGGFSATAGRITSTTSSHSLASNFSDDDEFDAYEPLSGVESPAVLCTVRAIYDYTAQQYDELSINAGDVLSVYDKQADGWWQGALAAGGGRLGIFPATYVQEM